MAKQTEFLPLPWEQAKGAQFQEVTGPLFERLQPCDGCGKLAELPPIAYTDKGEPNGAKRVCGPCFDKAVERLSATARDEGTGY